MAIPDKICWGFFFTIFLKDLLSHGYHRKSKGGSSMFIQSLNGKWNMKQTTEEEWIEATVPGDVYNDLLESNLIEDPFYGENEYDVLKLSYNDYEYTTDFEVSEGMLSYEKVFLCCQGLDTLAEIKINGKKIANTNNMHRLYEFDVKDILVMGKNNIHIVFSSPAQYVEKKHVENPLLERKDSLKGTYYLRKAHCMFGWDWGPKLPNMGVWRDILLKGYNSERIEQVYISQKHEKEKVSLDIRVNREIWTEENIKIHVDIKTPDNKIITRTIDGKNEVEHIRVDIENPQLWWPNGYGEHPLYEVVVKLLKKDMVLDSSVLKIGLRTVTVNQENDEWGQSFEVTVNGVLLFLMGGDYIPEDNLLARCSKERTEKLLKDCIKANFNCIRVWGGGYYPEDYLYELCDELGLLVWQDFMFACMVYELKNEFVENIKKEFIDNIRRIRHHASLALWCGNNEIEWGLSDDWIPDNEKARDDYIRQFHHIIPEVLKVEDPNTFYWTSSPSANRDFEDPNCDNIGDMHYWGVWHDTEPFVYYRKYFPRFMSEFGLQSFPGIKTVETFTSTEDRNIFSPVMESHQKNSTCNAKILHYISETFRYPKSFESLLTVSQLIQAEGIKYGVEHWRRNRGRCMGAIYWQLNDCWPVASWSSIDYFGRWKALHYAAKRFFAPILISACEEGTSVELHVTNETFDKAAGTVAWRLMNTTGDIIEQDEVAVEIEPLTAMCCTDLSFERILGTVEKQRNSYLEYEFIQRGKSISCGTVLFVKPKHFNFKDPNIEISIEEKKDYFIVHITSEAFAKYVVLDFKDMDCTFEDNYFDLSPGKEKTIRVLKADLSKQVNLQEFREQITVKSLIDTY